jgi:hypothetical protein
MRKQIEPLVNIGSLRLPRELAADVRMLLADPAKDRTRYGDLTTLTIKLFSNWRDDQFDRGANGAPPPPNPNLEPLV